MDTLWLGYDGLTIPYREVSAVLFYQSALDMRVVQSYGSVPVGVCSVVVTAGGNYLPARWHAEHLREQWARWRMQQGGTSTPVLQ